MNQQEKLRQRRLKQDNKMHDRRVNLGLVSKISKKIFAEFKNKPKEELVSEDVSIEEVKKILEAHNMVPKEESIITQAPEGESKEEKTDRIRKIRTTIYEKHSDLISLQHYNAKDALIALFAIKLDAENKEYKSKSAERKTNLDDQLADSDYASSRKEARDNYRDLITEATDDYEDAKKEITEELSTAIESLKEEADEKIDELKSQYESDLDYIEDENFNEEDLKLCQREFEAETITFDSLEEYVEPDDSDETSVDTDYSSSYDSDSGINIFGLMSKIIGFFVVAGVGYMVLSEVNKALLDVNNISNVTTDGITSTWVGISGIDTTMFFLLLAPLAVIIMWKSVRLIFNHGGRF